MSFDFNSRIVPRDQRVIIRPKQNLLTQIKQLVKQLDWLVHKRISTIFVRLKNLKAKVNYAYIRNVQHLTLAIQKKIFTSKVFVFYKLKIIKEQSSYSTLYSHISSPQVQMTCGDSELNSYRLTGDKVYALSKLFYVLNKPMQIQVLKTFWSIYLLKKSKPVKLKRKVLDFSIFRALEKFVISRKKLAFERVRSSQNSRSKFCYDLISKELIIAFKKVENFCVRHKKKWAKTAFQDLKLFRKRVFTYNNVLKFEFALRKLQKKIAFTKVLDYASLKRNIEKVNLLTCYLRKAVLKAEDFGFLVLKSHARKKKLKLIRFIEKVNKIFLGRASLALAKIRRFSNELVPTRQRSCFVSRTSSKLILLPTVLLEGDPCFSKDEFVFSAPTKRRTLFKS